MTAIHQLTPSFAPRDAIGNHILHVQSVLRDMGFRSDIYVGDAWREVEHLTKPFRELDGGADTWLLYHASTGSPIADFLRERPEPKLLDYHNITPAEMFGPWEPHVGVELQAARRQLAELQPHTTFAMADSSYNESELIELGYRRTAVVPILFDVATFEQRIDQRVVDRLRSEAKGGAVWLFVSRVAPNKAHHDLLKAFAVYRRVYDGEARLRILGGPASHRYLTALEEFRSALQLDDAVELTGNVSDELKAAHLEAADVYVSTSDHEGFGVTLLEAMHHGVPVVAYGSSAVPETMGDGGICLPTKEPATVAAAVHRVLTDRELRERVVAAGHRRVAAFDLSVTTARLRDVITGAIA